MRPIQAALLVALGLATTPAFAEHICTNSPDEVYVGNTPAGQGQASMPVCRWANTDQGTKTQRQQARIVDRYQVWDQRFGAIARDAEGPLGVAERHRTKEDAERAASEDCVRRGGDPQRCKFIEISYSNSCVVYTWGGGRSQAYSGGDPEEIKGLALKACGEVSGAQCDVIYEGCSMSEERWTYEKPPGWVPAE